MYRIEAAVRNGLTSSFCTTTANQWLQTTRTFNPWTLVMKIFVSEGRKNNHFCRHQRKNIIPSVNKGIWKCSYWMILLRVWKMFVLKVYCFHQFQSQILILLHILSCSRLMKFLKIFAASTIGLVNQLMLRIFLKIYLWTCQKKKYQKSNYWLKEKTIRNCGITTGKELLQPQKLLLIWPKWTKFSNPQVVVLICGHYVRICQDFLLLTLIYLPSNMVEPWKWKPQTNFLS